MPRRLVPLVLALLAAFSAHAQVAVEILDMPTEIYSFEPVWVLFAVQNTGRSPIYLPAEGAPKHGPGIYIGRNGEKPTPSLGIYGDRLFSHAQNTMWLAPGERWLFYRDAGSRIGVLEGDVSIQAVMSSDGRCGDQVTYGRHNYPLTAERRLETVRTGVVEADVYRCWQGEARSNERSLHVRKPDAPEDVEARDYLLRERSMVEDRERGTWRLRWASKIDRLYPTSHYTYALLARQSSIYATLEALKLQPENRLNPWLRGALAQRVLEQTSRCSEAPPLKVEVSIEDLEVPAGVRQYLEQHAWYVEHRLCAKSGNRGAAQDARPESEP